MRIHLFPRVLAGCAGIFLVGLMWSSSLRSEENPSRTASPAESDITELDRVILLGKEIVERTTEHPLSQPYAGNALTCSSCHLEGGRHPAAATFIGIATAYPAWSPRERKVITLEDRIMNCFMRSMNGIRPENGSELSVAIATYITSLSDGQCMTMNKKAPLGPNHVRPLSIDAAGHDLARGEKLYAEKCADCHSANGAGTEEGPPVWGERSYNEGAGLFRNGNLAAWLKVSMPLGDPSLSEQEALDIAAFVNSHPRPKFVYEDHLAPSK
ncbi:c-type cytochrome [Planctomicrobium sp. SH661]|uniref:c-type cytochrome n=1 Tax=Planctomicrobium sp. SH661 TaxID=3448124 RepID=UPI003F5C7D8E